MEGGVKPGKWGVWHGPEIEGRLVGMATVFIGSKPQTMDMGDLLGFLIKQPELHVLIGEGFIERETEWKALVESLLSAGKLVTLEVNVDQCRNLEPRLAKRVMILLTIAGPDFETLPLKPTDCVRITARPLKTAFALLKDLTITTPAQYAAADSPLLLALYGQDRRALVMGGGE